MPVGIQPRRVHGDREAPALGPVGVGVGRGLARDEDEKRADPRRAAERRVARDEAEASLILVEGDHRGHPEPLGQLVERRGGQFGERAAEQRESVALLGQQRDGSIPRRARVDKSGNGRGMREGAVQDLRGPCRAA